MTNKTKQPGVFHLPLNPRDSKTETEGCRHTNPSICARHSLPHVCAFVRNDGMCLEPSSSWAKQYEHLKEKSKGK